MVLRVALAAFSAVLNGRKERSGAPLARLVPGPRRELSPVCVCV